MTNWFKTSLLETKTHK